jgi:adenine-specific DNA-methyltransferase
MFLYVNVYKCNEDMRMSVKQKLELTWVGKGDEPKIEPRILVRDRTKDFGDPDNENMLIHGDNLLALKALEQKYAGKIKCIYIDPPYNTGSAFEHYDDNLEHSIWLSLIKPRLIALKNLLSDEGSIWISIDDTEQAYIKILMDEVFGRNNFINNVIWQKKYSPQNDAKWLSDNHDFIIVYAKDKNKWRPNLLPRTDEMNARYKNPDNDPRGVWKTSDLSVKTYSAAYDYPITTPSGRIVNPPAGRCWRTGRDNFNQLVEDNRIWWGVNNDSVPQIKRFLTEVKQGIVSLTIWLYEEVGHNQDARKEVLAINSENPFATPKPEALLQKIFTLSSNPGDLVLDSFLGSGTTSAVAHKMGRKWIGIELGDHCYTHCIPRMQKVIEGEQGGISKAVNWQGGGGFQFYELAPTLIVKDEFGIDIISDKYDATMLAMAVAKLQGFVYKQREDRPYIHGVNNLKNGFIYVTTQFVTDALLSEISSHFAHDESLLICTSAFELGLKGIYQNIKLKKIPESVLSKCEYGKENYNLNIIDLTPFDDEASDWDYYDE